MGCAPTRIKVISKVEFTVNSKKLPKIVLEGFGQVIKAGVLTTSKVVESKKPVSDGKVESKKEDEYKVEDLKDLGEVVGENNEKSEEVEEEFEEKIEEPVFFETQIVKTSELEESVQGVGSESEISSRPRTDLRRNTEKPVFENMAPVYIAGFE